MRDCSNATMRERLPDLLHDRLSAAERAEVHAHLNECADCRAELALIEQVRAATPAPAIDSQRIVSALPTYRPRSRWRHIVSSPVLQIAAALILVAGGAWLLSGRGATVDETVGPPRVAITPDTPTVARDTSRLEPRQQRRVQQPATELAVGELFEDLTDAELQALLEAFGSLQAVTPVETEPVAPAVNREGV